MDLYLVKTHVYLDNDRWIAVDLELYESDQA
jgi:hypothetical protein